MIIPARTVIRGSDRWEGEAGVPEVSNWDGKMKEESHYVDGVCPIVFVPIR